MIPAVHLAIHEIPNEICKAAVRGLDASKSMIGKLSGKKQEGLTVHEKVASHKCTSFKSDRLPGSSCQELSLSSVTACKKKKRD